MLDFRDFIAVTSVGDVLLRAAAHNPGKPGLVFTGESRTFGELAKGAIDRARALHALGVRRGDHVGILLPSCVEFVEVFFGITLLGAVAVPVNARYRSHELAYLVKDADLVGLVTSTRVAENVDFIERLGQAFPDLADQTGDTLNLEKAPLLRFIALVADGDVPGTVSRRAFAALAETVAPEVVDEVRRCVRVRDTALILYTSGTTSNPKGCLMSHEALVRTGQALAIRYDATGDDVFWSPLPMFHIAAIFPICAMSAVGATYVGMARFEAGEALELLEKHKVTMAYPSFGTFIGDMIYHPDFSRTDLSRIRVMNSNLAMQPDSFREALRKALPDCIQVGTYGMTETSGTVSTSRLTDDYRTRTQRLGHPLPGLEMRIVREDGTDADPDEIGEIAVRGFSVFSGYYKDEDKTRAAFRDGWFHTGDLGSRDAAGSVMFHGRTKDMLKVGGENVAALEIEALVGQHDAVKLCQVVGKPDARLQEVPVAFVELRPGASVDPAELIAYCRDRISGFKVPREIHFVTEWPMSASKIQKFMLQRRLG